MDWVVTPRRGGKSKAAVAWLNSGFGRSLLVANEQESRFLQREFGVHPKQVFVQGSLRRGMGTREVGVDNLDHLLYRLGIDNMSFATVTGNLVVPGSMIIGGNDD